MSGHQEVVATCAGEQADWRTSTHEEQMETVSQGKLTTSLKAGAPEYARTTLKRSPGPGRAAGGVRNTKDRDVPTLEVRAGTPAMVHTSRDGAGMSRTNRNRVKVARTSVESSTRSLCSEIEAEIRLLLL